MTAELTWSLAPSTLAALALCAGLYGWRRRAVRRAAGPRAASGGRLVLFAAGMLVLGVALVSPLDGLGDRLFVAHMAQHVLLADFASIALILGLTPAMLEPVREPLGRLRRAAGPLGSPFFALLLYATALWAWHAPPLYQAALEVGPVHALQHLSFAGVGLLFWWHVLSPIRPRDSLLGPGVGLYFAGAKLLNGALGMLVAFWPTVIYPFYGEQSRLWGLSALEDQELAAAVLIIEESIVLLVAFSFAFVRMLGDAEEDEREEYALGADR